MKKLIVIVLLLASTGVMAQQQSGENPQLEALKAEKSQPALQAKIKTLENGSAEDLDILIQFYAEDPVKRAGYIKRLVKKYPESQPAMMARLRPFMKLTKAQEGEGLLRSMMKDYPGVNLDIEKTLVACQYAEIPDTANVMRYINMIAIPAAKVGGLIQVLDIIADFDNATALHLAAKNLEMVKKTKQLPAQGSVTKIDPQTMYYRYINTYAKLLFKAGDNDEAYKFTTEAYNNIREKDEVLVENYAFLSSLNGRHGEALPVLSKAVKEGKFEQRYVDQVRKAYAHLHPGKDVDAYIADLQQDFIDKIKAHVATLLINEAAPEFTVTDVNGRKVSLADFKGKTIVLDFWATWCGPCVESFPAMQIAANRYANDPDVKFLFIHCWENVADPLTDARNFLSKRNYTFDLYMDPVDPDTKRSLAADAFKVNGIPAKFIIDGKGRIRFSVSGFSGKAEAAAEEVVQMVEMARK
ncbi:TlpA disulfide reductase family protein [Chitinophaga sp. XS-30]|uniref:TlpA family protein disulfide reductase n=1 Tax=Chitinophaga sp. XS-30 TaxID=2604421 RepID=UPI0011DD8D26|nr:TlpA disulfide reductase family protein [Chitinophaga sp. XS-30]QEH43235.1 TlpA family protein disulfide reductase [Chitinophaga sp. XS-30]